VPRKQKSGQSEQILVRTKPFSLKNDSYLLGLWLVLVKVSIFLDRNSL